MTSSTPSPLEPLYVVDTHALVWYLLGHPKLSKRVLAIFRQAEQGQTLLLLPSIVLAELYYANAKNKWFVDFATVYQDILSQPFFKSLPLTAEDVLNFDHDQAVPEMHDRIIAGVARRLSAPLISSDPLIVAAGIVTVVW